MRRAEQFGLGMVERPRHAACGKFYFFWARQIIRRFLEKRNSRIKILWRIKNSGVINGFPVTRSGNAHMRASDIKKNNHEASFLLNSSTRRTCSGSTFMLTAVKFAVQSPKRTEEKISCKCDPFSAGTRVI